VPDDHLVDVGLSELLGLDLVLLRRAQQVVEERHVELEHLDELDHAAIGDVELAVEVERPRIAVAAVLGDLAVVDVAGELGESWFFSSLGWNVPMPLRSVLVFDLPGEGVERAVFQRGIVFQAFLEQAGDGAFRGPHRPVEQQDALLGAVAVSGGAEEIDQVHQRLVQPEDGVGAVVDRVGEEMIAHVVLAANRVALGAEVQNHIVKPLERVARHRWVFRNQVEIIPEIPLPVLLLEAAHVHVARNDLDEFILGGHRPVPPWIAWPGAGPRGDTSPPETEKTGSGSSPATDGFRCAASTPDYRPASRMGLPRFQKPAHARPAAGWYEATGAKSIDNSA
jgi:hypothetical protein